MKRIGNKIIFENKRELREFMMKFIDDIEYEFKKEILEEKKYNYFPKNRSDLIRILSDLVKERGLEGDFNDIYTSNVEKMNNLFLSIGSEYFNGDVSRWDVSNVVNMSYMFFMNRIFNRDISKWDVSKVKYMDGMFQGAEKFNQDITKWNVSNVESMIAMFHKAKSFNQDISNWDVSKVRDIRNMFAGTTSFNQDIGSWNVSNVRIMSGMFYNAKSFNQDVSNWDISNVEDMSFMFKGSGICKNKYLREKIKDTWLRRFPEKKGIIEDAFGEC